MPYTRIRLHIVIATKNRRKWISPSVEDFLFPVLGKIARDVGGRALEIGGIEDHIHLVSAIPPELSVSKFVEQLKSRSTSAIRRNLNLWKFKWQDEYACFSVGPYEMDELIQYVRNQKEHHGRKTTLPRFELLEGR